MNEIDVVSTVDSVLGILAERFGSTVEHLWSLMIRQAYIEGITMLLFIVALTFVTFRAFKWFTTVATVHPDTHSMTESDTGITVVGGFCLWFLWLAAAINFTSMLTALINPEFYALKQVFSLLGGS